ncbi:MAG: hypothetical protein NTY35_04385 [Planctomycetota bacterium]|nr:hypothetical protein [Planctomycetota bacterium]
MNIKLLLPLVTALLLALPSACKSPSDDIPCTCGTAMTDFEGCAHPLCLAGKTNPDNPNCVCGKLEIPQGKKN